MMKRIVIANAAAALVALSMAFAQVDDWRALMEKGKALERNGKYAEAATAYRGAVRIAERAGDEDQRLTAATSSLAIMYDQMGRFADAEREYRRALAIVARVRGKDNPDYAVLLGNLATFYRYNIDAGVSAQREGMLQEAIAIFTKHLPANDQRLAVARSSLAEVLLTKRNYKEAERLLTQSLAVSERQTPPAWQDVGIAMNNLALVRQAQGHSEDAEQLFGKAIGTFESQGGPDHPMLVPALNNLAIICTKTGRNDDADATFRRALAIAESGLGLHHPVYAQVLQSYAYFLQKTGQKKEGKELLVRSKEVMSENARGYGLTIDAGLLGSAKRAP